MSLSNRVNFRKMNDDQISLPGSNNINSAGQSTISAEPCSYSGVYCIRRSKISLPVGLSETKLGPADMARARKCVGAIVAESEPARWSQSALNNLSWDKLYEDLVFAK